MLQQSTHPRRKLIAITNNNYLQFKKIPAHGTMNLIQCLPALLVISKRMGLRLNRTDNFNIVKEIMNRMVLEN